MAAFEVGPERATVAWAYMGHAVPHLEHLHAELVTQDAGVIEEGLTAMERVQVRTAHADPPHRDQRLARRWTPGLG